MWYFIRVKIYRMATLQCYNINMSSRFVKIGQSRPVPKTEQPNRPRLPWEKSQSAFKENKFRLYLIKRFCSKHKCFLSTKGSLTPASFHIYQLVVFVSTPCTELTQTSLTVITPGHADSLSVWSHRKRELWIQHGSRKMQRERKKDTRKISPQNDYDPKEKETFSSIKFYKRNITSL